MVASSGHSFEPDLSSRRFVVILSLNAEPEPEPVAARPPAVADRSSRWSFGRFFFFFFRFFPSLPLSPPLRAAVVVCCRSRCAARFGASATIRAASTSE
eukprot:SAG22_NODE_2556_length_2451_cov_1.704932_1_plen_99_part_00